MRHALFASTLGLVVLAFFAMPPLPQDPLYHVMADRRSAMGIPSALNVLSNLPFAFVGLYGLALTARNREATRWSYITLFAGTALTALGSSYYHLAPDNARLVWDRLPMTVGFAGLVTALIGERVNARAGQLLVAPVVLLGIASVVYWHAGELAGHGDLRPYAIVQFGSLLAVVMILLLYRKRDAGTAWFVGGLVAYGAAKAFELADQPIFAVGHVVSGHTLKHVAAAGGVACIAAMLRKRAPTAQRINMRSRSTRRSDSSRVKKSPEAWSTNAGSARGSSSIRQPERGLRRPVKPSGRWTTWRPRSRS